MTFSVSGGLIIAIGGQLPALAIGLIGAKALEAIAEIQKQQEKFYRQCCSLWHLQKLSQFIP